MKTSADYIREVMEKYKLETPKDTADFLGLSKQNVHNYVHGHHAFNDYSAVVIANALGIDPSETVAAANAEREKDPKKRKAFEKWFQTVAATVLGIAVILPQVIDSWSVLPHAVYYVKSRRRLAMAM